MMKPYENDLAATFAHQLDNVISERDRQRERKQAEYSKQRLLVERFVVRASAAIKLAVEAINMRAHDLRFDSPVAVETSCDFKDDAELAHGNVSLSASITVLMTRPRLDRERYFPDRGPSVSYNWNLYTSVCVGSQGEAERPSFSIEAYRNGWRDAWRCDIPTPECNPAGISLASDGDDVARRFMAWFTRYLA